MQVNVVKAMITFLGGRVAFNVPQLRGANVGADGARGGLERAVGEATRRDTASEAPALHQAEMSVAPALFVVNGGKYSIMLFYVMTKIQGHRIL